MTVTTQKSMLGQQAHATVGSDLLPTLMLRAQPPESET
jgi:hypothetical protein